MTSQKEEAATKLQKGYEHNLARHTLPPGQEHGKKGVPLVILADEESDEERPPRRVVPLIRSELFGFIPQIGRRCLPENNDVMHLREGGLIDDMLIAYYMDRLYEFLPLEEKESLFFFSPMFYGLLRGRTAPGKVQRADHSRVARHTRHVDIFEKELIIFPMGDDIHWVLIALFLPNGQLQADQKERKGPLMIVLNSLNEGAQRRKYFVTDLLYYLEAERKSRNKILDYKINEIRIEHPLVPHQENLKDCGLYIMEFARMLFEKPFLNWEKPEDKSDWFKQSSIDLLRHKLFADIITEKLFHEPSSVKEIGYVHLPTLRPNLSG